MDYARITADVEKAIQELLQEAPLRPGNILLVGCSTSEVAGKQIGTSSSLDVAAAIMEGIYPLCEERELFLAIQCCEHLNRALVVEKECVEKYNLDEVTVYPVQGAGGSLAYQAMQTLKQPLVVEKIQAHAGIDIGDTFIGMHIRPVLVPVRGTIKQIGEAHLTMGRSRPKLVGGERARYKPV